MKRLLPLLIIMGMVLVVAAGAADLKMAILAPLSGPVPTFGVSTRDGALLAIDEWNAKGGVLGMKIVPIVEDSQCTPDPAVNAANKVITQDGVHYIIGEVCSKASIPIAEIANAAKVIMMSPTSTNVAVTIDAKGKAKLYIFRACYTDPFQGKVGATFAYKTLGARKAFLMVDQANDYVKGLSEAFETNFKAFGGKIVGKESYTGTDTDFSAILAKVKDTKPDIVYLPDYYNVVNLATKQAKEKGLTVPFMGGDGWDSSDLDKIASAGGYYTNHYFPGDQRPEVVKLLKAYGANYQDDTGVAVVPDALAALAYDATNLVLQAIKNAGADNTDKVRVALEKISFSGVTGKIVYDAQHNPVKATVMLKVEGDEITYKALVQP